MNKFLTFRYSNAGWNTDNKYCLGDYAFFSIPSTNFVMYPSLKGNCTCGVTIQVAEQYDKKIRQGTGSIGNANTWFNKQFKNVWLNEWQESDEPVIGGIVCYDGWYSSGANCGGHVQFIYDIDYENNRMLVGESLYLTLPYQARWLPIAEKGKEQSLFNGYRFVCQGFLKPPYSIDKRVKRDTSKAQVKIVADELRVRKAPNGEVWEGQYFLTGIYDILETKELNGITWGKLGDDIWVGLVEDYVEVYKPTDKPKEDTDYKKLYLDLKKEVDDFVSKVK